MRPYGLRVEIGEVALDLCLGNVRSRIVERATDPSPQRRETFRIFEALPLPQTNSIAKRLTGGCEFAIPDGLAYLAKHVDGKGHADFLC